MCWVLHFYGHGRSVWRRRLFLRGGFGVWGGEGGVVFSCIGGSVMVVAVSAPRAFGALGGGVLSVCGFRDSSEAVRASFEWLIGWCTWDEGSWSVGGDL